LLNLHSKFLRHVPGGFDALSWCETDLIAALATATGAVVVDEGSRARREADAEALHLVVPDDRITLVRSLWVFDPFIGASSSSAVQHHQRVRIARDPCGPFRRKSGWRLDHVTAPPALHSQPRAAKNAGLALRAPIHATGQRLSPMCTVLPLLTMPTCRSR
jgi:hypothetical protein